MFYLTFFVGFVKIDYVLWGFRVDSKFIGVTVKNICYGFHQGCFMVRYLICVFTNKWIMNKEIKIILAVGEHFFPILSFLFHLLLFFTSWQRNKLWIGSLLPKFVYCRQFIYDIFNFLVLVKLGSKLVLIRMRLGYNFT